MRRRTIVHGALRERQDSDGTRASRREWLYEPLRRLAIRRADYCGQENRMIARNIVFVE